MQTATQISSAPNTAQDILAGLGAKKANKSKDLFLKLLVAQMKYQDPLNPQDPTKMATQLSQFNMVEQQIQSNALLTSLNLLQQASMNDPTSAASLLGHSILINSNQLNFDGTTPQDFTIKLDQNASAVEATIVDGSGNIVRHMPIGNLDVGSHSQTWDGATDDGANAPQGDYHIEISARDSAGNDISTTIMASGVVDAVRMTASGMILVVNGIEVPLSNVVEIKA